MYYALHFLSVISYLFLSFQAKVILLDYTQVPGIDRGRLFMKAMSVINKKNKASAECTYCGKSCLLICRDIN